MSEDFDNFNFDDWESDDEPIETKKSTEKKKEKSENPRLAEFRKLFKNKDKIKLKEEYHYFILGGSFTFKPDINNKPTKIKKGDNDWKKVFTDLTFFDVIEKSSDEFKNYTGLTELDDLVVGVPSTTLIDWTKLIIDRVNKGDIKKKIIILIDYEVLDKIGCHGNSKKVYDSISMGGRKGTHYNSGFCPDDLINMIKQLSKVPNISGIGFPFNYHINFLDYGKEKEYQDSQNKLKTELKKFFPENEIKEYFANISNIGKNKIGVTWDIFKKKKARREAERAETDLDKAIRLSLESEESDKKSRREAERAETNLDKAIRLSLESDKKSRREAERAETNLDKAIRLSLESDKKARREAEEDVKLRNDNYQSELSKGILPESIQIYEVQNDGFCGYRSLYNALTGKKKNVKNLHKIYKIRKPLDRQFLKFLQYISTEKKFDDAMKSEIKKQKESIKSNFGELELDDKLLSELLPKNPLIELRRWLKDYNEKKNNFETYFPNGKPIKDVPSLFHGLYLDAYANVELLTIISNFNDFNLVILNKKNDRFTLAVNPKPDNFDIKKNTIALYNERCHWNWAVIDSTHNSYIDEFYSKQKTNNKYSYLLYKYKYLKYKKKYLHLQKKLNFN